MSQWHRLRKQTPALLLCCVLATTGCSIPTTQDHQSASTNHPFVTRTAPQKPGDPAEGPAVPVVPFVAGTITDQQRSALQERWALFTHEHPGRIALALRPVGSDSALPSLTLGTDPTTLIAGTTIRVPVALAALRYKSLDGIALNDVVLSLGNNDADAARRLWRKLGNDTQAAHYTQRVLSLTGDSHTKVAARPAGRYGTGTRWTLDAQARFMSGLACQPDAGYVRDSLGAGTAHMGYGFGSMDTATVMDTTIPLAGQPATRKAVRQMVILDMGVHGFTALSIYAEALDGTVASAQRLLSEAAQWLDAVPFVPSGRCP